MARLSFSGESGMKSIDEYVLCQAFRRKGGAPKGGREEQAAGAKEGPLAREYGEATGYRERDPNKLSVMTKIPTSYQ